ncbi:MAG: acylphosphatase, partial [Archaeoglobales archaeon]
MKSTTKRITAYISGVVQGVGFRYFTRKVARETGVRGYVMNLPDGRVLIVAEGGEEQLEKFIST